jgi:hypothetical protein
MGDKGAGLTDGLLFSLPGLITIAGGSGAYFLFEEQAEGADAFKTDVLTYFCYGEVAGGQKPARLFDAFLCQVLVGSDFIDTGKKPVKMITGEAGFPGKPVQVERLPEVVIDINLSRDDFLIYIRGDGHNAGLKFLLTNLILVFQTLTRKLLAQFMGFTSSIFRNFIDGIDVIHTDAHLKTISLW